MENVAPVGQDFETLTGDDTSSRTSDDTEIPGDTPQSKTLSEAEEYLQSNFVNTYNASVALLASDPKFDDGMVPMTYCTGPAVQIARISALVGWTTLLVFSFVAFKASKCDDSGFVYYPWQLWFGFIPIIILKLYWQHRCLKYTTIPFIQVTGGFFICRCVDVGFSTWYVLTCILAVTQTLDYGTDSLFTAVVLRAGQCGQAELNAIWHEVISQSMFSLFAHMDFTTVACISYALMFIQPLVAFLHSTPGCFEQDPVDYTVSKQGNRFRNCWGIEKNLGDALYDLADVCDMSSIQVQSPKFPWDKAKLVWQDPQAPNKVSRILSFVHNALNRTLARLGLVTLLENTYQINLQVSIMAMFFFVTEHGPTTYEDLHPLYSLQIQTQISIALSAIAAFCKLGEVGQILTFAFWTIGKLRHEPVAKFEIVWVFAKAVLVIILTLLFTTFTTYAVIKYYHVICVCEDRLWNLSGCVDMSHFKKLS